MTNETPDAPETIGAGEAASEAGSKVRVVALELDNFKSFERKTTIPFRDGFTTISGPNGSGKSNIIDALLFVLGLASSKGMRAERLTDLLNATSKKKYARVALKLEIREGESVTPVEIARKVRRTRSGYVAHYEIDGETRKASELQDYLLELGLSSNGMNIVLQGDVTRLTNMSPLHRRRVLDDIAGISEFDRRIQAAREELGQASRHMEDIQLILVELEARLESLSTERDTALKYRGLRDVRISLEEDVQVLDGQKARDYALKLERQLGDLKARRAMLREKAEAAAAVLEAARAGLEKAENAYRAKGEGERLDAFKRREDLQSLLTGLEEKLKATSRELGEIKTKNGEREAELTRLGEREAGLSAKEAELQAKLDELGQRHDGVSREVARAMNQIRTQSAAQADKFEELNRLQIAARALREKERAFEKRESQLMEREAALKTEGAILRQTVDEQAARRESVSRQEAEAATGRRGAREGFAQEEQRHSRLVSRHHQLRDERDRSFDQLSEAERLLARAEERVRSVQIYTNSRALRVVQDSGIEGIHGTVRELCGFDADVAAALEACAGGRLNWVVVDDERVAKTCIETLKRNKAGRLTFAPLTKIRPPHVNLDRRPGGAGIVDFALNLVDYEAIYDEVFRYVFGDTLVIEDLKTGLPLIGRHRMVTLDGDLLEKRGLMTGGQKPKAAAAMANLAKAEQEVRERKKQVQALTKKRIKLAKEMDQVEAEARAAAARISQLKEDVAGTGASQLALKQELEEIDKRLVPARSRLEQVEKELAAAIDEAVEVVAERERLSEQLAGDEKRLQALTDETGDSEFEALSKVTEEKQVQLSELQDTMDSVRERFSSLLVDRRGVQERVGLVRLARDEAAERAGELAASLTGFEQEQVAGKSKLGELDIALGKIADELAVLDEARKAAQRLAQDKEQAAKGLEREGAAAELALTAAGEKVEQARQAYQDKRRDLEARGLEIPELPEDGYEEGDDPETLSRQSKEELKKTIAAMEKLEPVNMLAIDQYDEISTRRGELKERHESLTKEKDGLLQRMTDLEEAKRITFMTAFEAVRASFSSSFRELARGEGALRLENEEDPFDGGLIIEARPRGKDFARLEAMSGGEKSLTALAFLFALQSVNPAPFYIFDEVDQSLDGANTELLADAIRARSGERQYLVVSHHQAMINESGQLLGVTMRKGYGTRVTGISLAASA